MLSNFRPTYTVAAFGNISPEVLREQMPGLKAMTHDIDGYLIDYDDPYEAIPEQHLEVISQARDAGFLQAIISNTGTGPRAERSDALAEYIRQAVDLDKLPVINSVIPGCSKKPSKSMFEETARALEVKPSEICHGGDQMIKDVLGANRAGYGATILTLRYGDSDHRWVRRLQRPAEAALRPVLRLPILQSSFPETLTMNGGR